MRRRGVYPCAATQQYSRLPLTFNQQDTRALNRGTLALLPKEASVINFVRGPIVDADALIAHFNRGHLSHAVLDAFDAEPLRSQSPLWDHPNITVLPHISAPTNQQTASLIVANNIKKFLTHGEIPPSVHRTLGH